MDLTSASGQISISETFCQTNPGDSEAYQPQADQGDSEAYQPQADPVDSEAYQPQADQGDLMQPQVNLGELKQTIPIPAIVTLLSIISTGGQST